MLRISPRPMRPARPLASGLLIAGAATAGCPREPGGAPEPDFPAGLRNPDGGRWQGTTDLLLVHEDGSCTIVDHKIAPVPQGQWEALGREHAAQLAAYREAAAAQGVTVRESLLHLVLGGGVLRAVPPRDS